MGYSLDLSQNKLSKILKDLENKKHHDEARKSIDEDINIQDFIKKFDGKIKTDTIKPIK